MFWVGGGLTANLFVVWCLYGFGELLCEVYACGAVLVGILVGMNCWFEALMIDLFGFMLALLCDGFGFLFGSVCLYYDGEPQWRLFYCGFVDGGFLFGYVVDNDAVLVFCGIELVEMVVLCDGAAVYCV